MYLHSVNLIQSVTTRKGWLTTMKSMVTTGESVTARKDGNWGRMGWQPNFVSSVRKTPTTSYDEPTGKIPPGVPERGGG